MGSPLFSCSYQNDITGLLAGNIFHGPFDHFDDPARGPPLHPPDGRRPGVAPIRERADYTARVTTAEDTCACENKGTSSSCRPTATSARATTPSSSTTAGWPTPTSAWSSSRTSSSSRPCPGGHGDLPADPDRGQEGRRRQGHPGPCRRRQVRGPQGRPPQACVDRPSRPSCCPSPRATTTCRRARATRWTSVATSSSSGAYGARARASRA